jgi:hypothetical protein
MFWKKQRSKVYEIKSNQVNHFGLMHGFWIQLCPEIHCSQTGWTVDAYLTDTYYSYAFTIAQGLISSPKEEFYDHKGTYQITELEGSVADIALCIEDSARAAHHTFVEMKNLEQKALMLSTQNPMGLTNIDETLQGYSEQIGLLQDGLDAFSQNARNLYKQIMKEIESFSRTAQSLSVPDINSLTLLNERNSKLSDLIQGFKSLD